MRLCLKNEIWACDPLTLELNWMAWNDYVVYIQFPSYGDGLLLHSYRLTKKHIRTAILKISRYLKNHQVQLSGRLEMRRVNIREVECLSKIWQVRSAGAATTSQVFWLPDDCFTSKMYSNYVAGQLCCLIL